MYKEYTQKIIENGSKEGMILLNELFNEAMEHIINCDSKMCKDIESKLYEYVYGKKVNEEMAKKWVENMKPVGEHWNIEQIQSAIQSLGYNVDVIDFYAVVNMIYNDFNNLVKDNEEMCLKMAYDWLDDEDAVSDKLYEYYKHIPKKD